MTFVTLKLKLQELELLTDLASDQMFRREFIDPKMPGHRAVKGEVGTGRALVAKLQSALERERRKGK